MQLKKFFNISFLIFFLYLLFYSIKNLGYYFDITSQPIKSDIIICLGGENGTRIKKSLDLLNNNYSTKNIILLTDRYQNNLNLKLDFLERSSIKRENIISTSETFNTYEELIFAKKFMLMNNYNSIIILSTEPHSKRIKILIENFIKFSENNITYTIVGENTRWWDKKEYYKNKNAIFFILREIFKIIYNYIFYTLDPIFEFDNKTIIQLIKIKTKTYEFIFD